MTMMKKHFRLVVMAVCISMLLSLLGCGKEKPHMLDGPDMEYAPPWSAFTISRSDSYAQYNFWFTVTEADPDAMVTGVCRDEEGTMYEEETGIPIPGETLWALRWMDLEQLTDAAESEKQDEGPEALDGSDITFPVTLKDGTVAKKYISEELSLEIYQLLLPCFINDQS